MGMSGRVQPATATSPLDPVARRRRLGRSGPVLLMLAGGIAYAMTHTINADDVGAEIPSELALAAHPRFDG